MEAYNTLNELDYARIAVETAKAQLEAAYEALDEAGRVHRAAEDVEAIEDRDEALDELADEVGYELAEAILLCDRGPEEPEPEPKPAPEPPCYEPERLEDY
jgi:division protein CdvB (Snf7/Vps24/ESCRT-III family)